MVTQSPCSWHSLYVPDQLSTFESKAVLLSGLMTSFPWTLTDRPCYLSNVHTTPVFSSDNITHSKLNESWTLTSAAWGTQSCFGPPDSVHQSNLPKLLPQTGFLPDKHCAASPEPAQRRRGSAFSISTTGLVQLQSDTLSITQSFSWLLWGGSLYPPLGSSQSII